MRVQLLEAHSMALVGGSSLTFAAGSIIGPAAGDFPVGQISNFAATSFMLGLDAAGVAAVAAAGGPRPYRIQTIATSLATSALTAAGGATLTFAAVPALGPPVAGCAVTNLTSPAVIPANTSVVSKTATTIVISANATGAGVGSGDVLLFGGYLPPSWGGPGDRPAYQGGSGLNYSNA